MGEAAALLVGTHDFAAFAGQGLGAGIDMDEVAWAGQSEQGAGSSTTRTVYLARVLVLDPSASPWAWGAPTPGFHAGQQAGQKGANIATQTQTHGRLVAVDIVANAFLPQMVRTIVGTLLDIGYGKRTVQDMTEIIHSRDRRRAGQTAKPHGLCLLWVSYNSHDMGHHTNGVPDRI
jgi:tRNA U38,U39,U40 pseudouridine synthase TruA